jgi:nucleotidyltransferase substrate binding protein (TIGR01987 family)
MTELPEKLTLSFNLLQKALVALKQMVDKPMQADRSNVDACIQRFEFCVELYWKLLRRILETKGQEAVYPKDVLRAAYRGKLIDNEDLWIGMLIDRNQTSHTYNEKLADEIYGRIKQYYPLMSKTFQKLSDDFERSEGSP